MPRILVVDDNPVDRKLMGRLLEKVPDWQVETVSDGIAALEYLVDHPVDLVVTDLQMPEINGVELVRQVRKRYPKIPVLLVTAFGSERESLEGLQAGAANFSHKSRLSIDLVPTAKTVIDWSHKVQSWSHLEPGTECEAQMAFVLDNDITKIPRLIETFSDRLPHWARADELRISMALDEALTNAICHGNLEVDSAHKENAEVTAYESSLNGRLDCEPFCCRRVKVQANFSNEQIQFQIRDEGRGFDQHGLLDPREPENIMKAGGRGLLLIRSFMDEVLHNHAGNEITLVKRRPPA
jgi:CheY-like chemotaxis protein